MLDTNHSNIFIFSLNYLFGASSLLLRTKAAKFSSICNVNNLYTFGCAVAYAQIDWHDFVVVETVDFQPSETGNLPPPTTPDEVGARLLQQQRFDDGIVTVSSLLVASHSECVS